MIRLFGLGAIVVIIGAAIPNFWVGLLGAALMVWAALVIPRGGYPR